MRSDSGQAMTELIYESISARTTPSLGELIYLGQGMTALIYVLLLLRTAQKTEFVGLRSGHFKEEHSVSNFL